MGVGDWFESFCGNLRIGPEKRSSLAYRTGRIVGQLNADLRNLESKTSYRFYVGSYGRSTAIPSVSDVDLLYELPAALYERFNKYQGNGQSALLAHVRTSLQRTYPTSTIGGDGQVVVIVFNDGVTFEVLPAFFNTANGYTFADSNGGGSWRTCQPKQEMAAFSTRNNACNGNLIELARMTRAWRDKNSVPMSGMLIDTLAYQFIGTWQYRDKSYLYYDWMARDFFEFLAGQNTMQTYWSAPGSGSRVYGGGFQYKARQGELRIQEAIGSQLNNYNYTAKQIYRGLYGNAFPS
ncbi:SMODS domain-containing nucleotidyltransferase [Alcaligenes faecalis]|uniref:Nucleotidyltransferase n=1 Tax=Alcaligenes faecalis TaxID=511 RepID=A0A2U2BLS0_ALCFA|nr:nucleotidyltransferase [Alcaligenes faecalis]PWE14929.1 nucleotidyltransferase [Alcaligenes faecalis]